MTNFKIRDGSTTADRLAVLAAELEALTGNKCLVAKLCHDIISSRFCQYHAILAEVIMSEYGVSSERFDKADHDYMLAYEHLVKKWPNLRFERLTAIVTAYRSAHLLDELIDSLAGMSVVSASCSSETTNPCH